MADDSEESDNNTMEALPEDMEDSDRVRIAANAGSDDENSDSSDE